MKPQIIFGPYIVRNSSNPLMPNGESVATGFSVEWATACQAHRIALFTSSENADRIPRLEHLVVPTNQLPFPVECHLHHVLQTAQGLLVPLEALLVRLYGTHSVAVPIFDFAEELTSLIPLRNTVSTPLNCAGLLIPAAETRGYRLNTILASRDGPIAEIVWIPRADRDPFHVCLCRLSTLDQSTKCEWIPSRNIGISQLFAAGLRHIVPGSAATLFSRLGLDVLMSRLQQEVASHPAD